MNSGHLYKKKNMKNSSKINKINTSKIVLFISTLVSVFYIGLTFYNEENTTFAFERETVQIVEKLNVK